MTPKAWWHAKRAHPDREAIQRQVEWRERRYDATILKLFAKKQRRDPE
jgi:hypothetical protein